MRANEDIHSFDAILDENMARKVLPNGRNSTGILYLLYGTDGYAGKETRENVTVGTCRKSRHKQNLYIPNRTRIDRTWNWIVLQNCRRTWPKSGTYPTNLSIQLGTFAVLLCYAITGADCFPSAGRFPMEHFPCKGTIWQSAVSRLALLGRNKKFSAAFHILYQMVPTL